MLKTRLLNNFNILIYEMFDTINQVKANNPEFNLFIDRCMVNRKYQQICNENIIDYFKIDRDYSIVKFLYNIALTYNQETNLYSYFIIDAKRTGQAIVKHIMTLLGDKDNDENLPYHDSSLVQRLNIIDDTVVDLAILEFDKPTLNNNIYSEKEFKGLYNLKDFTILDYNIRNKKIYVSFRFKDKLMIEMYQNQLICPIIKCYGIVDRTDGINDIVTDYRINSLELKIINDHFVKFKPVETTITWSQNE